MLDATGVRSDQSCISSTTNRTSKTFLSIRSTQPLEITKTTPINLDVTIEQILCPGNDKNIASQDGREVTTVEHKHKAVLQNSAEDEEHAGNTKETILKQTERVFT